MQCYPAIDILAGRCVRLRRGEFGSVTDYGDPLEVATRYAASGAEWLHVVDLDAARSGEPVNRALVAALARSSGAKVQAGGGIRDVDAAAELLEAGVDRVVLGTAAVEQPGLAAELAARHPGRIAVGLDHRRGTHGEREVVVRGWTEGSGLDPVALLAELESVPLGALVVTDVGRDGMLAGPDLDGLGEMLAMTALPLVASGGVAGSADLRALSALRRAGRGLAGAIVGRALLSGEVTLEEAIAACAA